MGWSVINGFTKSAFENSLLKPVQLKRHSFILVGLFIIASMLLQACTTHQTSNSPYIVSEQEQSKTNQEYLLEPSETSLEALLTKAKRSSSPLRENYLLHAVQFTLHQDKPERANQIYRFIKYEPIRNEPKLLFRYYLIGVDLAIKLEDLTAAATKIGDIRLLLKQGSLTLDQKEQQSLAYMLAKFYEVNGQYLTSARTLIFSVDGDESRQALQPLHEQIWNILDKVPPKKLEKLITNSKQLPPNDYFKAWIDLSFLMKNTSVNIEQQLKLLKDWHQHWSHTKVAIAPPLSIQQLLTTELKQYQRIALLLPSEGPFKHAAKAIQDGILASHYQNLASRQNIELRIYNTESNISATDLYLRAVDEGAEFVIGPLKKEKAKILLDSQHFPVPLITLNYVPDSASHSKVLQFGLRAEDEAIQVARTAWKKGHQRALVLFPDSDWGYRMNQAFSEEWKLLGGEILGQKNFTKPQEFSTEIKEMLNISRSEQRKGLIRRLLGKKIEFQPRRRQDVDMIFLAASPTEGRQLKPTLNFHFAQNLPVYSTSHIYDGIENPSQNSDLNNIKFVDIPWVLNDKDDLKLNFQKAWPQSQSRFQRLHAMGIDAYRLMQRYSLIENLPQTQIPGATGVLAVDEQKSVFRQLSWAEFKKGKAKLIVEETKKDEEFLNSYQPFEFSAQQNTNSDTETNLLSPE